MSTDIGSLIKKGSPELATLLSFQGTIANVLESMPDAMVIVSKMGKVVFSNNLMESLFGYTSEELHGKSVELLIPVAQRKRHCEYREGYLKTPNVRRMGANKMLSFVKKDGEEIPCDISLCPLTMGDGDFVVCSIRDISGRYNTQENLRKTETEHLRLQEYSNAVPWELNATTGKYSYVGSRIENLTGYDKSQWLDKGFLKSLIHPDDIEKSENYYELSLKISQSFEFDYRILKKNGAYAWIHQIVNVARSNGSPDVLRGFLVDITESKNAAIALHSTYEELRSVKNRLERLSDSAPIGLCYMDENLRIVHLNSYLAKMKRLPIEAYIGDRIDNVFTNLSKFSVKLQDMIDCKKIIVEERVDGMNDQLSDSCHLVTCYSDKSEQGDIVGIHCVVKDIQELKKLEFENALLRENVNLKQAHKRILGSSYVARKLLSLVRQVAPTEASVLLEGETGTGKELIAREIHKLSPRAKNMMVTVNCAALPATLIESELFGREKGAFTGALAKQFGRFETANNSSIFLDEIGELPLELQPKLLRVLQEGEFERLGGTKTIKSNVRIIAATNRNLQQLISEGKFRSDLYYRLSTFPIALPPLRDRKEDIPELVWSIVEEFRISMGKPVKNIPEVDMLHLINYPWHGNVRELRNVIERSMILSTDKTLNIELPSLKSNNSYTTSRKMQKVEREHILNVLDETHWRIRGSQGAASLLGLKPTTLESRMTKLGIKRAD